jgi:hypothetical protein
MDDALQQLIRDAFRGVATDVFLLEDEQPRVRHIGKVKTLHPGPIAEAKRLGIVPDKAIDGGLGIKEKYFAVDEEPEEGPPIREIREATHPLPPTPPPA